MSTEYIGGIALIGDPGSGKTSISEEVMTALGWDRISFAAALKEDIGALLSLDATDTRQMEYYAEMYSPATKDKYRPLLQTYGSFRRAENPNYWVDKVIRGIVDEKYVIDDCRYFNEYEALRARGFKFIYLQRGPTTRALPAEQAAHESEQDWHRFKTDIVLTYEPGPKHQAERIIRMLKLNGDIEDDHAGWGAPIFDAPGQRELDAATKGLAGAIAKCSVCGYGSSKDCDAPDWYCGCGGYHQHSSHTQLVAGPDDTMDSTLFNTTMPGNTRTMTMTFTPPFVGQIDLHFDQVEQADEDSVAWPI